MNKILWVLLISLLPALSHAGSYTCYRYVNGSPTGTWIKIQAESKDVAEDKAYIRMKELGSKVDYAKCK